MNHNSVASDYRERLQPEIAEGVIDHRIRPAQLRFGARRTAPSIGEELTQPDPQPIRRQAAVDPALERKRDLAGLFGHDDGNGVGFLGQADRGAMTRAQLATELGIDGERQKAGCRGDPVLLDDDGAIVQRRGRLEDADEQVVCHRRVERDAALDAIAQADVAFEDDDGAGAAVGQRLAATVSSSMVSPSPSRRVKNWKKGARPKCASARRMSDWKMTMAAKTT